MNYYNENDPFAAKWLRNLIAAGLIPPGHVDDRSIKDVQGRDLDGYTQCHFFCGIAGWSYALELAGWPADEPVWTGSCPCQPFSSAGKGLGTDDARHLWPEFCRLINECNPSIVFGEQVASKAGLGWLDGVFADLEASSYACGASDTCAAGVGAPHIRQRLYWMANAASRGSSTIAGNGGNGVAKTKPTKHERGLRHISPVGVSLGDTEQPGLEGHAGHGGDGHEPGRLDTHADGSTAASGWDDYALVRCIEPTRHGGQVEKWRRVERGTCPLVAGLPRGVVPSGDISKQEANSSAEARVGRLRGYGNSIVPVQAAQFIRASVEAIGDMR